MPNSSLVSSDSFSLQFGSEEAFADELTALSPDESHLLSAALWPGTDGLDSHSF
jgi:hypothetical protein